MVKTINDYYEELYKAFPDIPKEDVQRAVKYGWRSLYYHNLMGCDTLVSSTKHNYWFYIGELRKDPIKHFTYYKRQLARKLRIIYRRKKIEWDGYYYTALNDAEYQSLVESRNKRGRKKRHYSFERKIAYKLFDECKLAYSWSKYLIRFKWPMDVGFTIYRENLKIDDPEVVLIKDAPSKFSDLLVNNNNYEFI